MSPVRWLKGLGAGFASALVCYPEYLGLGAVLGPVLLGYGDQSKSVGALLVILSAALAGLVLALTRIKLIAGPRAASLSILVLALATLQSWFSPTAVQQIPLLACLMLGCGAMLLVTSHRCVQQVFDRLPRWLVPSFTYASAVGITAGAASKYLYSCLQISVWQSWAIFLSATLVGVLWPVLCRALATGLCARRPGAANLLNSLQGLALMLAALWAWLAYELSALALARGGRCARLGQVDIDIHVLLERSESLLHGWTVAQIPALLCATVLGMAVGIVVAIEARTAADMLADTEPTSTPPASHLLKLNSLICLPLLALTSVMPSPSQSRTQMLWNLARPSSWAVACHALSLLFIAALASSYIAWLPQLALAMLMTLVATQMVSNGVRDIWRKAYDPSVFAPIGIRAGLGLWLVLGIAALTGQVLLSLLLPALIYAVLHWLRVRKLQKRRPGRIARSGCR